MGILEKYQIVTMLGAGETSSFRAQEVSTGRPVVVHRFLRDQTSPGRPDLMSMVYNYLSRSDAPGIENYLDSGEEGDTVYIVTSDVPECLVLRQWLQTMATALGDGGAAAEISPAGPGSADAFAASSPEPFEPSPPETNHEPGEFTSMFNAPVSQAPTPAAALPSPDLKAGPASKPDDKFSGGQVPSGFEVVYRSRKRTTDPGPPPEPVTPTAATDLEATMLVAKPAAPAPTPPIPGGTAVKPARPGENSSPGEFTQMFSGVGKGNAGQPLQPAAPATAKPPSVAARSNESGPGQFTGIFGGVGAGSANVPSAPPPVRAPNAPSPRAPADSSGPGEFTQMFTTPHATPGQPASPPSSPGAAKPSPPPDSPAQKGPGQFTMMFQLGAHGSASSEPPPVGPSPLPATPPTGSGLQRPIQQKPVSAASKSASDSPGEFTQMFKSGGEPLRSPGLGTPSRPQAPLSSSSKKGPGEFTMLTQAYKPTTGTPAAPKVLETPKAPPAPPAADTKKGPGEFTMMFRPPSPPAAPVPQATPPPPATVQAPPPRAHQAGEYTSIFEAPRIPAAAPPAAPPGAPPPGYGYPAAPVAPPSPQMPVYQPPAPPMAPQIAYPQAPQYQPAPPPAPQMPAVAMPPPPQPQPMPPTGAGKPAIFWILLLALGCLFLAAVILVLFFALKH